MKSNYIIASVLLAVSVSHVMCAGGGRAFPRQAEKYTMDVLQGINSHLVWDPSNHLTDLAGMEVDCAVTSTSVKLLSKTTQDGKTVSAVLDYGEGGASDVNSVAGYLATLIDTWPDKQGIVTQVKGASKVGCSVLPGCGGYLSVACLFSPGSDVSGSLTKPEQPQQDQPEHEEAVYAQAFTDEQYAVAEGIIGSQWDRSHYLENLSGMETNCGMLGTSDWHWHYPRLVPDMHIIGQYGSAENVGDTEPALVNILAGFKHYPQAIDVGCSLIPDCKHNGRMYVVASCLYQE